MAHPALEQNRNKSLRFDAGGGIVGQVREARLNGPLSFSPQFLRQAGTSFMALAGTAASFACPGFLHPSLKAPMTHTNPSTRSKRSRVTRAQRVLASLIAGAGVDEIGAAERLTRKRTESILRQELRNRWIAPADDFAKLQIARLEQMILKLLDRLQDGDLKAIDRALKIVDRLDRYHGFTKATRIPEQYGEEERARLLKKVNEIADRLQPELPAE
jgi:hypothetical protein